MSSINCFDVHGNSISVLAEELVFHPAVYGIFIANDEILLVRDEETSLLRLPGNVLLSSEIPAQVLCREYHRFTGIAPVVGPLLFIEELYSVDGDGRAWHLSAMFYLLERPLTSPISFTLPENGARPEMHVVGNIQRKDLQFGYEAIQSALLYLQSP